MSNICLNIEFLAGTSIDQAAEEAIELVNRLGIAYVRFDFNGVNCSVGRRATSFKCSRNLQRSYEVRLEMVGV